MSLLRIILGTSDTDVRIALQHISINPTISASITYQVISNRDGIKDYEYTIDGQQYAAWDSDDTIIYHIICRRHHLEYIPYVEPEFYEEAFVYKNEQGEIVSEMIRKPNPKYVAPPSQLTLDSQPESQPEAQPEAQPESQPEAQPESQPAPTSSSNT